MSTSLTTFRRLALEFRKHNDELQTIYSQVVQNVGDRIYRHSRTSSREGQGSRNGKSNIITTHSLTYPQYGFNINPAKGLYLSGFGYVRIFIHRPMLGKVKRLTIKREADGWYHLHH
ncbi:MAG: hypothetical protein QXG05_08475 [Nitrososphaerota archaeon]